MDEQFNQQEEDSSSSNKDTNSGHKFTPKPHHRLKYVKKEFNIQREDVQIPYDIMEQIEKDEYDGYKNQLRKYYRSRIIAVSIFLSSTLISLTIATLWKNGFEFGNFLRILVFAYIGSLILVIIRGPLGKKPQYSDLTKSERKQKFTENYIDKVYYRLKNDHDREQAKLFNERYQMLGENIECLFPEMAMILYFKDKVHLLNYRTWLSLGVNGVYYYLQKVFEKSSLEVVNLRPFFMLVSGQEKVCGLYFSYATTPAGASIVEKITRMREIHLVEEIYFVSVVECPEKVRMQLRQANINSITLKDMVSSFYYILKFDKIIHPIAEITIPEERISLLNLYDVVTKYTIVYLEHLFDLATWDFEEELDKKSEIYSKYFISDLKQNFVTNPFAENDEIDLRKRRFQSILNFPVTIQKPFYDYREFEMMNSSKKQVPWNWSAYPRSEKGTVIIR